MDTLIIVNSSDTKLGLIDKITAHEIGILHRAFSVVLLRKFNGTIQTLLQKRSNEKYHAPGLWSNTCCSHFVPKQTAEDRISQRLIYEMGINIPVTFCEKFQYKCNVGNLIENEVDHVYIGWSNVEPTPNPKEVSEYMWEDINRNFYDESFTPWLPMVMDIVKKKIN